MGCDRPILYVFSACAEVVPMVVRRSLPNEPLCDVRCPN